LDCLFKKMVMMAAKHLSFSVPNIVMIILSKLYLDDNTNLLFYLGSIVSLLISLVPIIVFKKIKKHIKELGELDG